MNQKNLLLPIISLSLLVTFLLIYFQISSKNQPGLLPETVEDVSPSNNSYEEVYGKPMPSVVSHFACSDYCPGGKERYTIQIYLGVTDKEECEFLGGSLYSYTGWGTTTVCSLNKARIR